MVDVDVAALNRKVDEIAEKLDALSASVDKRFEEVSEHFVEQRQYTELAFDTLRAEMRDGFAEMRAGFARIDARFERMDQRFAGMDEKFTLFIETQGGINRDHSRQLTALQAGRRRKT